MGELKFTCHLVPIEQDDDWRRLFNNGKLRQAPRIIITADLYFYIYDLLRWIPTRRGSFGGFAGALPVIGIEAASIAKKLFLALASLFAIGPEAFTLTGLYTIMDYNKHGSYTMFTCDRENVLSILTGLAEFAAIVEKGTHLIYVSDLGDYYDR